MGEDRRGEGRKEGEQKKIYTTIKKEKNTAYLQVEWHCRA